MEKNFIGYLFLYVIAMIECYEVPEAQIELLQPRGFRVSIPDNEGISLFAFHGNVNQDFEQGHEAGQVAVDVLRKKNGRWTYTNPDIQLKSGDVLYYWLHVVYKGLAYERLFQSYSVTGGLPDDKYKETTTIKYVPPCTESYTKVNGGKQLCSGTLVFDSQFSNGLSQNWSHIVQFSEDEAEFTVFDNDPVNTFVSAGSLVIKPMLLDHKYGKGFTSSQKLDLSDRCTAPAATNVCVKVPLGRIFLPPILSARLTTEHTFTFRYGIVEIKARLPHGDWVVPEMWLLPKTFNNGRTNSGKIILGNSFGNSDLRINGENKGNNYFYSGLEVGTKQSYSGYTKTFGLISDDYHTFKMIWRPDEIRFYYDNQDIGGWNSNDQPGFLNDDEKIAPFNQEFYLVLGVHVGGLYDFPDGCLNSGKQKPWKNTEVARAKNFYDDSENWLRTWNEDTALRVEYVKVWAL